MNLLFSLHLEGSQAIPIDYNYYLQSAIYANISSELAEFLHNQGYAVAEKKFKLFTFSRLYSKNFRMDVASHRLCLCGDVNFTVASPTEQFCRELASHILRQGKIRIANTEFAVKGIEAEEVLLSNADAMMYTKEGDSSEKKTEQITITVKTLSPVAAYMGMNRPDGRKYSVFFQPGEQDFDAIVGKNLCAKYMAIHGKNAECHDTNITVRPCGHIKQNRAYYKGTVIKGWSGMLDVTGAPELLQVALDAGLGSKNSQGFGCVKLVKINNILSKGE